MLDRIVTFCLSQRVFVLVLVAALAGFGVRAALNLRIEAFPDVQDVQVQVIAQFPGQAPEEMERLVALPIEREMAGVPRLMQLRSVSITGLSVVTLTFAEGTDDYFARQQVLEKLQIVNLPPGVQPQLAPLSNALGEIYRYALEAPPDMPSYEVRAIQDWIVRPYLRIVPGVADVISFGGTVKEYQVKLNPFQLKKYAVTIDQVAQAIANASSNAGGGMLRRGEEALVVRGIGLFRTIDDIRRVAVASRQGRPILVSDIATIVEVGPRPRSGIVGFNDRDDVVEGVVQMIKGQNAKFVVEALHERLDGLKARLPPGVKIVPIYERTDLINHTVRTVAENLALGAALVIAILVLFLRNWRAALIVAAVIPLSLLVAFIMIDARGMSANLISLGAVDFGIIVDSAVVLVEALMVRLAIGANDQNPAHRTYGWRLQTLRHTVVELGHPILFAKAIIILAFLPIFTFQRVEGKIFSPVAYTLSFALLGAVILTVTFVPTLLSYAIRGDMAERESRWQHALQDRYRRLLVMGARARAGGRLRCDRPARGRAHRPPDARERVPAQARRGQHLAHAHAAARVLAREHQAGRARRARDPAQLSRGQVGRHAGGPARRRHRPEAVQQPGDPRRPPAARDLALPDQGSPGHRYGGQGAYAPGGLDQLLAGDPGQRRGSALGCEGRDRREGRRARPRHPRGQGRPDRVDPEGDPRRDRRRGVPGRRPERGPHRDRPGEARALRHQHRGRERGDPDRARGERGERVLRRRPALRRHAPGRPAVPGRGRRHREPAGVDPARRGGEPAAPASRPRSTSATSRRSRSGRARRGSAARPAAGTWR